MKNSQARGTGLTSPLEQGTWGPDFTLPASPGQTAGLRDFRDRPVILVFYPGDWEPVSADQLGQYEEALPEFGRFNAALLAISVDSIWCHRAFARQQNLSFPLLADFEPKGTVARAYGVYQPDSGTSGRALFVLDGQGQVRWSYLAPLGVNPGIDGILTALEKLTGCSAGQVA